ncbi:MAG: helix-turn-helix transcriptional regulator [Hyphomicrobium sp.]|nr:helix-turn-helix transcriptional regulator [Hyphomicrobium sp.]
MSVALSEPMPIRVSSGPLAPGAVVRGHEGFMKLNMQLDFANRSPNGRKLSVVARSFGPVGVGRVDGTPSSFYRRPSHLADGRDLLSIIISGGGRFELDGARGDNRFTGHGAAILESRRASALHSLDDSTAWTICMERAPMEPLLAGISQPLQCCLASDNPALRLLDAYLAALFSLPQAWDLALVTLHIRDLALSALGVRGDVQALVRERGVQAARQAAALAAIRERASEPGLTAEFIAAQVGLSVRYLHRLLEPTGRTFAEHLLDHRLDRAVAMLRDSDNTHRKIGEIAFLSGFSDISHFNRSFRRRFGDTPHGVRVRAARSRAWS